MKYNYIIVMWHYICIYNTRCYLYVLSENVFICLVLFFPLVLICTVKKWMILSYNSDCYKLCLMLLLESDGILSWGRKRPKICFSKEPPTQKYAKGVKDRSESEEQHDLCWTCTVARLISSYIFICSIDFYFLLLFFFAAGDHLTPSEEWLSEWQLNGHCSDKGND